MEILGIFAAIQITTIEEKNDKKRNGKENDNTTTKKKNCLESKPQ